VLNHCSYFSSSTEEVDLVDKSYTDAIKSSFATISDSTFFFPTNGITSTFTGNA
jgi:hypothetical protein